LLACAELGLLVVETAESDADGVTVGWTAEPFADGEAVGAMVRGVPVGTTGVPVATTLGQAWAAPMGEGAVSRVLVSQTGSCQKQEVSEIV
jgi:uncharacterized membrane protein YeaQ/YmgE (transglycosylase-associated protein family)